MEKQLSTDECYASFIIYTGNIDPQDITRMLGAEPSMAQLKGEKFVTPAGRERVSKHSVWKISSESEVGSSNAADHVSWIVDRLSRMREAVRNIPAMGDVKMWIRLVVFSSAPSWVGKLNIDQMEILSDLNVQYSVGVYFDDGG